MGLRWCVLAATSAVIVTFACASPIDHASTTGGSLPPTCDNVLTSGPLPSNGSCDDGWWLYDDEFCSPFGIGGNNGITCSDAGDGRCYRKCVADGDCTDPCFPTCVSVALYDGGDCCFCGDSVSVCGNEYAPGSCQ